MNSLFDIDKAKQAAIQRFSPTIEKMAGDYVKLTRMKMFLEEKELVQDYDDWLKQKLKETKEQAKG